ncbi:N-carbamoyl-L-amino-acid hydrolase [Methylobacterium cerastii]|uniref:N-carbamoyl-L-amino-acid hydrolase n=1 Tax=Methylobacterium cerastii TaxID=932741 RepID=A0ABQ4QHW2_9HYPH|nr:MULTISPECIES: Zn-dependent hydrolase [Methylobacterium]TXN79364.1 Zn-dependent hydrolase [Methylobacterium sp. WL8]GJD44817.1 N-carbamoyl-L-amino-acid hydrolase [Methylobacterium cerastii]
MAGTAKTHNLRVDGSRLWATIAETARFGATPAGGLNRLTLSPEDGQVRDWFRDACQAAGLTVRVDALGTQYALRPGRDASRLPVAFGSHLDTQPTGGRFDGILGVLAGLEAMRALNDAGIETEAPLLLVNWTNEEGSRFAPAMMASAAYAGDFTTDEILDKTDAAGITVGDALDAIGYRGTDAVGDQAIGAFVELHIEQGPILEAEGLTVGVVEGGQGIAWFDGTITGFEAHAGTTPMPRRRDALLGLAEIALAVERIARAHAPTAVATVGEAVIGAPSRNVVPGLVRFTLDVRDPKSEVLDAIEAELRASLPAIAERRNLAVDLARIWRKEPVPFDPGVIAAVDAAAESLGLSRRRMVSGAGHDACNLAGRVPTAMIFVPCKDGVSHNESESATPADCAAGADVLLQTVLTLANAPKA